MNDYKKIEDIEKIKLILHKYFNNDFTINVESDEYTIILDCSSKSISMMKDKNEFIITYINDGNVKNKINISLLLSCDKFTGTQILRNIICIANELNIIDIILADASSILFDKCYFYLSPLFILLKGQSWYNSLGFVYENYEIDMIYNNNLLSNTTTDFLKNIEIPLPNYSTFHKKGNDFLMKQNEAIKKYYERNNNIKINFEKLLKKHF